jgi:hypothetical protein
MHSPSTTTATHTFVASAMPDTISAPTGVMTVIPAEYTAKTLASYSSGAPLCTAADTSTVVMLSAMPSGIKTTISRIKRLLPSSINGETPTMSVAIVRIRSAPIAICQAERRFSRRARSGATSAMPA